jgi:beta-glucanase (GH16 family)
MKGQSLNTRLPWALTWHEDFDHAPLDGNKWCRIDWRAYHFGRTDLKAFRTEPVNPPDNLAWQSQGNGSLTYVTQIVKSESRTRLSDSISDSVFFLEPVTYRYTAPSFMTSKAKFRYGYFEIRCKSPVLSPGENNKGLGANFWMYKETPITRYPSSEIDIFEFVSEPVPHTFSANAHHLTDWHPKGFHAYPRPEPVPDFQSFHTFGAWWGPDFIKYYIDGYCYREAPDSIKMIANQMIAMPLIIDINVFTNLPNEIPDANTRFPYAYDIDYVKVYQINTAQCNTDYINCSPIPALPSVYRKMTIGGGGCVFPSGSSKGLTSRTDITILPGFEASLGSELVLDIYPYCHSSELTNCQTCTQCD